MAQFKVVKNNIRYRWIFFIRQRFTSTNCDIVLFLCDSFESQLTQTAPTFLKSCLKQSMKFDKSPEKEECTEISNLCFFIGNFALA